MTTTPPAFPIRPSALAVAAATAVVLTACSSGSSGHSAAQAQYSEIKAATESGPTSSAPTGPTVDLATLDACALLTPADANRVGHAEQFDPLQDASTVYRLTVRRPGVGAGGSCTFAITDGVEEGSAEFLLRSATAFHVGPSDTPTTGLGDEAYDDGDDPVVRVGNVMISTTGNSFPDSFTVALIRAVIPKLK